MSLSDCDEEGDGDVDGDGGDSGVEGNDGGGVVAVAGEVVTGFSGGCEDIISK